MVQPVRAPSTSPHPTTSGHVAQLPTACTCSPYLRALSHFPERAWGWRRQGVTHPSPQLPQDKEHGSILLQHPVSQAASASVTHGVSSLSNGPAWAAFFPLSLLHSPCWCFLHLQVPVFWAWFFQKPT